MDVFFSQLFFLIVTPLSVHQLVLCGLLTVHRRVLRDDHAWVNPQNTLNITSFAVLCTRAHSLTRAHTDTTPLCTCTHGDKCVHSSNEHCAPNTHTLELSESDICVWERCFEVLLGGLEPRFEGTAGRLVLLHARFLKGPLRPSMPSGAVYQGLPTISHIKALKEAQELDWMSHTSKLLLLMYDCICSSYYPETIL